MLNTLDVLIAFTVIFSVLSVCVTIIVQMVSAALALRGKNLANALSLTFQTIDPKIGAHAQDLATRILKDPIFSDSLWTRKSREPLTPQQAALVAAQRAELEATRALASCMEKADEFRLELSHIAAELGRVTPGRPEERTPLKAREQAARAERVKVYTEEKAAEARLNSAKGAVAVAEGAGGLTLPNPAAAGRTKPWFMWSFFHNALTMGSAIRPGEVYRIIHEWSDLTDAEKRLQGIPQEVAKSAGDLLKALGTPDGPAEEARRKLGAVVDIANLFTTAGQQQAVVGAIAEFGATVDRATTQAYDRFQRWFGSAQDRAEQWFTAHTKIITIFCGLAIAIGLQLDTIEIFRILRSQPELVKKLVEKAPVVLAEGGMVLDPTNTPAFHTYELWLEKHPLYPLTTLPGTASADGYGAALKVRVAGEPNAKYLLARYEAEYEKPSKAQPKPDPATAQGKPDPANAAIAAYVAWKAKFPAYALVADPDPAKATAQDIKTSLQARAFAVNKSELGEDGKAKTTILAQWVADYAALFPAGTKLFQEADKKAYVALTTAIQQAGFDLVPPRLFHRWRVWNLDHWLGMAITVGLLSLGAPFWFNLLKNLMNLRPAVAKLVEKRPNSSPALPQEPATPA